MKLFITLLFVCVLFVSCSHAELEPILSDEYKGNSKITLAQMGDSLESKESLARVQQHQAVMALFKYLRLDGTRYVLDITQDEAENLGVASEMYKVIVDQLEVENKNIAEYIEQGIQFNLPDPQRQLRNYNNEQLIRSSRGYMKARSQYKFSGRITTTGQEQGSDSFTTTTATNSVVFRCSTTGGALIASHTCTVSAFGVKNQGAGVSSPMCSAVIELPVAGSGSGIIAKLTYQTSCPGGGYCVWSSN